MRIDTFDRATDWLGQRMSPEEEANFLEEVKSDEDMAEDFMFSLSVIQTVKIQQRAEISQRIKRIEAKRNFKINFLRGIAAVGFVILATVGFLYLPPYLSKDSGSEITANETDILFEDLYEPEDKEFLDPTIYGKAIQESQAAMLDSSRTAALIEALSGEDTTLYDSLFSIKDAMVIEASDVLKELALQINTGNAYAADSLVNEFNSIQQRLEPTLVEYARSYELSLIELQQKDNTRQEKSKPTPNLNKLKKAIVCRSTNFEDGQAYIRKEAADNDKYGLLYTWRTAKSLCPDLWTIEEWDSIVAKNGGVNILHEADDKTTFLNLKDSGYPIVLAGSARSLGSEVSGFKKEGLYWSASEASKEKAWAYFFYKEYDEYKIHKVTIRKSHFLSCLCPK